MEVAEAAASEGRSFCIGRADVGADTTAVREAVLKIMDQKVSGSVFAVLPNFSSYMFWKYKRFTCSQFLFFFNAILVVGDVFLLPYYYQLKLIVNTEK